MSTICGILSLLSYTVPFAADSWVIVTEPVPEEGSMLLAGSSMRTRTPAPHQQPTTTMLMTAGTTLSSAMTLTVTAATPFSTRAGGEAVTEATNDSGGLGHSRRTAVVFARTSIHVGVWTMCPHVFMSPSNKSTQSSEHKHNHHITKIIQAVIRGIKK